MISFFITCLEGEEVVNGFLLRFSSNFCAHKQTSAENTYNCPEQSSQLNIVHCCPGEFARKIYWRALQSQRSNLWDDYRLSTQSRSRWIFSSKSILGPSTSTHVERGNYRIWKSPPFWEPSQILTIIISRALVALPWQSSCWARIEWSSCFSS